MRGYKVAQLPPHRRLSEYLYHHCKNKLTDQPLGFLTSLKFVPSWVTGTWKLEVKGMNWGEENVAEFRQDEVHLLRITGEQVSISELALCMYRAEQVVAIAREVIGHHQNFELAAELTLNKTYRVGVKTVMANDLNDRFHMSLLETEHFLLSIAPIRTEVVE